MDAKLIAGRYRLESLLGRTAMSEVWLAEDTELERPVALKLLAPDADRARFDREAHAAATLAHPNVTRLYDYGETEGRPYMALEYLPGGTLEERLTEGQRLRDDETAVIAAQLAAGLAHAHAHGLVHRDLKPANVLFDGEGRAKLADFGIARVGGSVTLTDAGTVMGTAGYISPEQAAGKPAGPTSDVYSFGAVLYRMLSGRLPFEAESPLELVELHRNVDPPALEVLRPDVPPHLAALAAAAMSKDPRDRPPDGAALAVALGEEPPGPATAAAAKTAVIRRRARRPAVPVALIAVAVLLLAAAGVATGVLLTHSGTTAPSPTTKARTNRIGSTQGTVPIAATHPSTPSTAATATARPRSPAPTPAPPPTATPPATTEPATAPTTTEPPPTTTSSATTTAPDG